MKTRRRREVITPEQVKEIIQRGMKFVPINNRIFDDYYEQKVLTYHPIVDKYKDGFLQFDSSQTLETTFNALDMIVFIFLRFLNYNDIVLRNKEMADYLKCTERHLKESIYKLKCLRGVVNSKYNPNDDTVEIVPDREVRLIQEKKTIGYENGKKVPEKALYVEYVPKYVKQKDKAEMTQYFCVTIQDLDLYTNGHLERNEFLLYLFFIRTDTDKENKKAVNYSNSRIGERIRIKGVHTTLEKHIQKLSDNGLIEINYPKNYTINITKRVEPSREFIPIANRKIMAQYRVADEIQVEDDVMPDWNDGYDQEVTSSPFDILA